MVSCRIPMATVKARSRWEKEQFFVIGAVCGRKGKCGKEIGSTEGGLNGN